MVPPADGTAGSTRRSSLKTDHSRTTSSRSGLRSVQVADYLRALKKTVLVDVFLGYRSNCDHAGIEIPHTSLEMFTELEISFGISIVVT